MLYLPFVYYVLTSLFRSGHLVQIYICTVDFSCVMLNCATNSRKSQIGSLTYFPFMFLRTHFWLEWDVPDKPDILKALIINLIPSKEF